MTQRYFLKILLSRVPCDRCGTAAPRGRRPHALLSTPCFGRHHELDGSGEVRDGPHRQAVPDHQPGQALLHVSCSSSNQRRPACVIARVRVGRYYNSWHQCKYDHSDEEPQCQKLRQWSYSMCPTTWVRLSSQPPPLRRVTATAISASLHPRRRPRRSHARCRHRSPPSPPSPSPPSPARPPDAYFTSPTAPHQIEKWEEQRANGTYPGPVPGEARHAQSQKGGKLATSVATAQPGG